MTDQIMNLKKLKKLSVILIILATILLVLNIIDIKLIFGKTETGLWDKMPGYVRQTLWLAYPILLLTSYILSIWTRKVKTRFQNIANILFWVNGLAIIMLLVINLTELTRNL